MSTSLRKAMLACGRYSDAREVDERIRDMKEEVAMGGDPEEILHEEGFEPDYIFDILETF